MHYKELSTPALTIDLDILEANLDRMARYCSENGLRLRPHTKTHKTPEVSRMQVGRGAVGLTVAKVGEAEVMADAGLDDILVAYPIWGAEKLQRLATLARSRNMLLSLDNEATAQELSRAMAAQDASIGVLVEFDLELREGGVDVGELGVGGAVTGEDVGGELEEAWKLAAGVGVVFDDDVGAEEFEGGAGPLGLGKAGAAGGELECELDGVGVEVGGGAGGGEGLVATTAIVDAKVLEYTDGGGLMEGDVANS